MTVPPLSASQPLPVSVGSRAGMLFGKIGQKKETFSEDFLSTLPGDHYFDASQDILNVQRGQKPGRKKSAGAPGLLGKSFSALGAGVTSALKWGGGSALLMWPPAALMGVLGFIPMIGHFLFMPIAIVLASIPVLLGSITGALSALKALKK